MRMLLVVEAVGEHWNPLLLRLIFLALVKESGAWPALQSLP
jgi:hypothetical protein